MKTNKKLNIQCAKIIKGLDALKHLVINVKYNYFSLKTIYNMRKKIKDIEYKQIECAFNNFILTASIIKQYIKSFEKLLDSKYLNSKKYSKTINMLFNNEFYLILLGMRNYLQHIFHFKIGIGNLGNNNEDDLYIAGFTLLKHEELHRDKPENIAFKKFFENYFILPIMDFASENMCLINIFYNKYNNIIHDHYKSIFAKYQNNSNVDQYALDMHELYFNNINSFKWKSI